MSKYTTQVRFICEELSGETQSQGYNKVDDIINKAIPLIFSFNFPIFDESYRNVLCNKILKHYYTREICEETVGLWRLRLETRLNEIMPYYNQLYKSELIQFNPLYDTEVKTISKDTKAESTDRSGNNETTRNASDTANTTNNGTRKDLYSDTPQGSLQNVENETYLTNARKIIDNTTTQLTGTSNQSENNNYTDGTTFNSTDDYINDVVGKTGGKSYSQMLQEFRSTFLNIDTQIIDELNDLFFGLW